MQRLCERARSRAPRSFFTCGGTGSSCAVAVPGRGEYGKTCTFVSPAARTVASVFANARSSSAGKPTITSLVRLNSSWSGASRRRYVATRVAAAHRAEHAVVAGLERHVQVPADGRRLAQRGDELVVDVVDLDRGEAQPLEPRRRARLAHEARQAVAGRAVAVAAEVDPGEHDLAVALLDAAPDLGEHGVGAAAARGAAHERDHAEGAREAAAVLHLDERAHAVEPRVGLDAADRADVARDERGRLLAAARDDHDVLRAGPANASAARFAPQPVT